MRFFTQLFLVILLFVGKAVFAGSPDLFNLFSNTAKPPTLAQVKAAISGGANVNAKGNWRDLKDVTVLMLAAKSTDDPAIIVALVEAGAHVSARDSQDKSVIDYAEENELLKNSPVFKALTTVTDHPRKDQPTEAISYNPLGPVIKKLALGMNIDTIPAILQESLGVKCKVIDMGSGYTTGIFGLFMASANKSKQVTMLNFLSPMFNASDMDSDSFVSEITKAYKIPETKPFLLHKPLTRSIEAGHEYSSPDGWKIKIISAEKSVELEIIPKATDRKFD